jgi:hypothetical protein
MPPAALAVDSDESFCSEDSAPFPLPLEELDKYPAAQRKQQQEANRFYNFFERYALEVSEAGGLCATAADSYATATATATATSSSDRGMRNAKSLFDESSLNAEENDDINTNGVNNGGVFAKDGMTNANGTKKRVRWDLPQLGGCGSGGEYGDFYDRYMLVVTEAGAACGPNASTEPTAGSTSTSKQGAVGIDQKASPTSTMETGHVNVNVNAASNDKNKQNKELDEDEEDDGEESWNLNQLNCTEACAGVSTTLPWNFIKFWESLAAHEEEMENENINENENEISRDNKTRAATLAAKEVRNELTCFALFCKQSASRVSYKSD